MNPSITELERQLAEKHRQLDAEYAERIRLIQAECVHEYAEKHYQPNGVSVVCSDCGIDLVALCLDNVSKK